MAKHILIFRIFNQTNYRRPPFPITFIFIFIFITTVSFVFSQTSSTDCILDIEHVSSWNGSYCTARDWGVFLDNKKCCALAFDAYLNALGHHANQTGQIYLNFDAQTSCIASMKKRAEGDDIEGCGIEKLTSGAGGCSDYSVTDVVNKLGRELRELDEDCKHLGSDQESNQTCHACLRRWEEIGESSGPSIHSKEVEANVCRFAVLVSLTSSRIDDEKWVRDVYRCLSEQSLSVDSEKGGHAREKISTGLGVLIGGLVGILVILLIASWIIFRKRTEDDLPKEKDASNDSLSEQYSNYLNIPIKKIYSATDNLSVSNFIGQGIAGKVYKGTLSNGQHIAVKHIINDDGYVETFVREVTSLSHVRHPNLVPLLGYCEKEEDECFLVYELCHNGNLSEWLYGKEKILSWNLRLEIAIDCARGLWFLHTYPEGCIVHRDIKPTNILLCDNFQAKLSDFGLSKVIDLGESHVSSEVRGTFGYVDPEYQKNHHVNSSGDVYSFGIVLLQILSGQRVINLNSKTPMSLEKMARFLTRGKNITEFADPKLNGEYSVEAFDLVMKLALSCTGIKQQRPSMEKVVLRLEQALDISTNEKSISFTTRFTTNMA